MAGDGGDAKEVEMEKMLKMPKSLEEVVKLFTSQMIFQSCQEAKGQALMVPSSGED